MRRNISKNVSFFFVKNLSAFKEITGCERQSRTNMVRVPRLRRKLFGLN
jgi:hypothetical protein